MSSLVLYDMPVNLHVNVYYVSIQSTVLGKMHQEGKCGYFIYPN